MKLLIGNFLEDIKKAANKRILYLPHAIHQMTRPDRMILPEEVRHVIEQGEIIEDYLAIITAYIPSMEEWEENYKNRKKA